MSGLHVGLNLLFLVPGETGGRETHAVELIGALRRERPELRLTAFVNREAAAAAPSWLPSGVDAVTVVPVHARERWQWAFGEQVLLPRLAARARVDVLHSVANTGPARVGCAHVVTVHDLLYRRFPEYHTRVARVATGAVMRLAVRGAARAICISEATRAELVALYGTPLERIDVVPNGGGVPPVATPTPAASLRARLGVGERPIVLTLAVRLRHKNVEALADAAAAIPVERRPVFVVAGQPTFLDAAVSRRAASLGVADSLRLLPWVSSEDLEGLYAAASCFAFPSVYEGFGLPVLEAMARGVPVACSDIPPLREVGGDAAVYFDPRAPRSIAAAVEQLLGAGGPGPGGRPGSVAGPGPGAAAELVARGRERAALFTWEAAARGTAASYARAFTAHAAR
jgi:glycosyltransferase involved in cell wall biosynthesis